MLALPARFVDDGQVKEIVKAWFSADFEGGRHERRVEKIIEAEDQDFK